MQTAKARARANRAAARLAIPSARDEPPHVPSDTCAELRIEHMGRRAITLTCNPIWQAYAIARGEPVLVRIEFPNYELKDPSSDRTELALHLVDAEEVLEAALATVREAKRLGFAGPQRNTAATA
jgi:hypothetical protein